VDPTRLRLFSVLSALFAVAFGDRYPDLGAWGLSLLKAMVK
jgi:hypothetical protein